MTDKNTEGNYMYPTQEIKDLAEEIFGLLSDRGDLTTSEIRGVLEFLAKDIRNNNLKISNLGE